MPTVETIKASDASAPLNKTSKAAAELVYGINSLTNDEVLPLTPDEGKSLRGLKTGVGRIASNNLKVKSWDDGTALYGRRAVPLDLLVGADRVVDRVRHPLNHPRHGA